MHLEITFDEKAFAHSEEQSTTTFDKPDFKKFNMRFNNLDLIIIDAIAKRNGTSRSQIINSFIERMLKDFVLRCPKYEALFITEHAEAINVDSTKSDKNFAWDEWYADTALAENIDYLWLAKDRLQNDIENKNISKELVTLVSKLKKARANSSETKPKP
jgi:hypothetical protein